MKSSIRFEARLESTGSTLRDRPSLVDQIMAEIRQHVVGQAQSQEKPSDR